MKVLVAEDNAMERLGDFPHNADLDVDIAPIVMHNADGTTRPIKDAEKNDLVEFLIGLTDDRVKYERAPFDHPQLCVPNGEMGSTTSVTREGAASIQAMDSLMCVPAVGASGHATPLQPFLELDPRSGGVPDAPTPPAPAPAPAAPLPTGPAAATGTLVLSGVTAPGGLLRMGTHTWVADHIQGLCRLDAAADGSLGINTSTCNLAAVAPGQPAFDAAAGFVYVPDGSSKSAGVWRLTFDAATETVGQPVLLAAGQGLAGTRPTSVALGPDHQLYVGSRSPDIKRITDPAAATQTLESVGSTTDAAGAVGIAFVGNDLYLAQAAAVTKLAAAPSCSGTCLAEATAVQVVTPTALAADVGAGVLYVSDTPTDTSVVRRYRLSTGTQDVLANAGNLNGASTNFMFADGLWVDPTGAVFVGDDPTAGLQALQGHVWKVVPPAP